MKCENCDHEAINGYRFCKICKEVMLVVFVSSGYLTPRVKVGNNRTYEMKENQLETRKGLDL